MSRNDFKEIKLDQDFTVVDIWPPLTCTEAVMKAYRMLEEQGNIKIQKPIEVSRSTGRVTIRYTSDLPRDWIHDQLKRLKQLIIDKGEQQKMEV